MNKHEVTNIPLLFACLVLIIACGILSFIKNDSKKWYVYLLALVALEAISIIYLAFL